MRVEGVSKFGQTTTLHVPYRKLLRRLYCMVKGRVYMYVHICMYVSLYVCCGVFDSESEVAKSH